MIGSAENRGSRTARRRASSVALAGAAAAAMTLGVAAAPAGLPEASAAITVDVTWEPVYTAGTLASILNLVSNAFPGTDLSLADGFSYHTGPPASIEAAISQTLAGITLNLNLDLIIKNVTSGLGNLNAGTANLYNILGGIPTPTCSQSYAGNCRYDFMLGTSEAALYLAQAYQAQVAGVTTGDTPAGYIPFQPAPNATAAKPTWTNQALAFLGNPMRPNGGILSRFPDISKAQGINPVMQAAGKYKSPDGRVVLNTTTVDAAWAYDPSADFPAVFNLTAIANSLMAALPLNLLGGLEGYVLADSSGQPADIAGIGLNLAAVLQLGPLPEIPLFTPGGYLAMADGKAYYATLIPNQLPILTPLRLPGTLINFGLNALGSPYLLGNPIADAIEPALRILVNIAYPDVVTPTDGGTYNRTFLTSGVQTPFGSVEPLTPEEKKAVPGDVWNALIEGVKAQLAKPFLGILVPNTGTSSAAVTPAAAKPVAVKAAAATPVVEAAPVTAPVAPPVGAVESPAPAVQVSAPAADPAPAVQVSAPAADPAPVSAPAAPKVEISLPADDPAPAPAPRAAGQRGAAASVGSDNSDAPKASASTRGHRGAA